MIDTKTDSKKIGDLYAKTISTEQEYFSVCESYEGGFGLSLNGEKYAGGSYDMLDWTEGRGNIYLSSAGGPNTFNRVIATYKMLHEGVNALGVHNNNSDKISICLDINL
jgi:hypothetical protein